MSRTVVSALSRVVAHRTSRRGLLARSAFGATALAVAPVAFTMRPISPRRQFAGVRIPRVVAETTVVMVFRIFAAS